MLKTTAIQILKIDAMIEHLSLYGRFSSKHLEELKQLKIDIYEFEIYLYDSQKKYTPSRRTVQGL